MGDSDGLDRVWFYEWVWAGDAQNCIYCRSLWLGVCSTLEVNVAGGDWSGQYSDRQ